MSRQGALHQRECAQSWWVSVVVFASIFYADTACPGLWRAQYGHAISSDTSFLQFPFVEQHFFSTTKQVQQLS